MAELKAAIRIRAEDRSSAALEKVARGSKKLEGHVAAARKELANLDRKDSAIRKFRSLKAGMAAAGTEAGRAKARTAELAREIRNAESPSAKLRKEFDAQRRKSRDLTASHRRQREELHSLRRELRQAGVDTTHLGDAQRRIARDLERSARGMERMGQAAMRIPEAQKRLDRSSQRVASASLLSGELSRIGQRAWRAVAAPIEGLRQVERSMGDLMGLGMSREEASLVAGRGRALSRRVAGVTTPVFTGAAYDIRSGISSLDAAGVADYAELASLAAVATKADLGQMTSLFGTAYGMFKGSLFEELSDLEFGELFAAQLSAAVKEFKTEGPKMQQAIESMGAGLAQSGVSLEEQIAVLAMLQAAMPAGQAGTALAGVEKTIAKAQDYFDKAGVDVRLLGADGNMRSIAEVVGELERALGEYNTRIGAQIQEAFGSEEARKLFQALWGQQAGIAEGAAKVAAEGARGKESVSERVKAAQDNTDARLEKLEQRWGTLAEDVGRTLDPAVNWGAGKLEDLLSGAERFVERSPLLTGVLAAGAGGFGLLALAAGPAIVAVAGLKWAIDRFRLSAARAALSTGIPLSGGSATAGGFRPRDLLRGKGWKALPGQAWRGLKSMRGLRAGGAIGAGIATVAAASTLLNEELSGREKASALATDAGGIGGGLAGGLAGAKIGALAGSVVPGPGTAIGAAVGGLIGSLGGGYAGSSLASAAGDALFGDSQGLAAALEEDRSASQEAADAAAGSGNRVVNINNEITIEQLAGEDPQALAEYVIRETERVQALAGREALGDAY